MVASLRIGCAGDRCGTHRECHVESTPPLSLAARPATSGFGGHHQRAFPAAL